MIDNLDNAPETETVEKKKGRQVTLLLLRHGEAIDQSLEAELSENGVLQAKTVAKELLDQIQREGGGIVKIISSPVKRAKQTANIIEETMNSQLSEHNEIPVKMMHQRERDALKVGGVIGPLMNEGIAYEETVQYWLENPEIVPGRTPKKIADTVREVIAKLEKMSERLPSGEKIYYLGITHEIPQAALIFQELGNTPKDLGSNIGNCEAIKIEMSGKKGESPVLTFRNDRIELKNQEDQ